MFDMHLSPEFLSVTDYVEPLQHFLYFVLSIQNYATHEYKGLFFILMWRNAKSSGLWEEMHLLMIYRAVNHRLGTGTYL